MSKYDLEKLRKQLKEKSKGKGRDPLEWKAPKAGPTDTHTFRFIVLPPLEEGETCVGGKASKTAELFHVQHGQHWINNRPHTCPRITHDEDCPFCQLGFDLLETVPKEDKATRTKIARTYLCSAQYMMNIYFPKCKQNPEELWDKVFYFDAPKTSFDQMFDTFMKDAGDVDPTDPSAYGVFYDPDNAFIYQLEVFKKGDWNDYTRSKFLTKSAPIAESQEEIKKILDRRIDLFTKIEKVDYETLSRLTQEMANSGDGGFDHDEEKKPASKPSSESTERPEPKTEVKTESKASTTPKKEEKPASKPKKEEPKKEDDDDLGGIDDIESMLTQLGSEE